MAFSASPLSEGEAQCPRSGHYPCENIRPRFLLLPAHVWSVPLTRQSSPQSQPEASSPEHWVPWIQGLCLFSSAHPSQTHISQAWIPKAVLLFNYQLNSLPLKPLFVTLNAIFSTVHHSFHSTSKQTRVDCPAQRPPWGPSALWKTVCSHPGFVHLTVSNHSNGLLSPFKLLNGPVRIWDKDFKTPNYIFQISFFLFARWTAFMD